MTGRGAIDFDAINRAALSAGHRFLSALVPGGKLRSVEYVVCNPSRNDRSPGSFKINFRTGAWADFASGDRGGDVIGWYACARNLSQGDAARDIARQLGIEPGTASNGHAVNDHRAAPERAEPRPIIVSPGAGDTEAEPIAFPARTAPDAEGKPTFKIAGDDGPAPRPDEVRRHFYKRGGVPVRIKIKREGVGFLNWYRVVEANGATGWQAAKPDGFDPVPYVGTLDPFDSELLADFIYWPEGEKDVDTLTRHCLPALTFGGTGDGLPDGCERFLVGRHIVILADNDNPGRDHVAKKVALAHGVAASVRVIDFPELPLKSDVSDWIEQGHRAEELADLADKVPQGAPSPADPAASGPNPTAELIVRRASEVAPEKVEWLWPGRVAVGKLTLIGGTPGLGKSQLTAFAAKAVSTGGRWPCGEGGAPLGSVILFSAEDGLADTIIPRLAMAGADRNRVHVVTGVQDKDGRRGFDLKGDIAGLETLARKLRDVRLIVIDPISAYMGGNTDGNDNVKTRNVLEPMAEMADRLRIAVVAVTHLNKSGGGGQSALNRFIGSIAFVAAARAAFAVVEDAEDKTRRLFLQVKNNLASAAPGLAFRIEQAMLPGTDILASGVCFDAEPVEISANDALAASEAVGGGDERSGKDEAADFLRTVLTGGPVPAKEIERQAIEAGLLSAGKPISQNKVIRLARDALGIKPYRQGGTASAGQWVWGLPDHPKMPSNPLRCPPLEQGILGNSGHLSSQEDAK